MHRSWRKRAAALLLALLVMVGLFLGWTSINYTSRMRKTVDEENARSAALWASMTEARLGAVYEHIYELLIALYNNTELRADTPIMSARARIRIVDTMADKLIASDNADAFSSLTRRTTTSCSPRKRACPARRCCSSSPSRTTTRWSCAAISATGAG